MIVNTNVTDTDNKGDALFVHYQSAIHNSLNQTILSMYLLPRVVLKISTVLKLHMCVPSSILDGRSQILRRFAYYGGHLIQGFYPGPVQVFYVSVHN